MSKILLYTTLLAICLGSMIPASSGKTCTKELINNYQVYVMNKFTQKLHSEMRFHKRIVFECCEGYTEIGRIDRGTVPTCVRSDISETSPDSTERYYTTLPPHIRTTKKTHSFETRLAPLNECGPCHLGKCISGQCICPQGYNLTMEGNGCQPWCSQLCTNGKCTRPQFCECMDGFTYDFMSQECRSSVTEIDVYTPLNTFPPKERIPIMETSTPTPFYTTRRTITLASSPSSQCGPCHLGKCISGICICPQGYNQTQLGNCQPWCSQICLNGRCIAPDQCECIEGFTYDASSRHCRPMCNGKLYGCLHGTCVGYNQCRCDGGFVLNTKDEFECVVEKSIAKQSTYWFWCLLFWILGLAAVIVWSFIIIINRWKNAKANRKDALGDTFTEVRYNNPETDHSLTDGYDRACAKGHSSIDESIFGTGTIRRDASMII